MEKETMMMTLKFKMFLTKMMNVGDDVIVIKN